MRRSMILLVFTAVLMAVLPASATALTSEPGKAAQLQRALRYGDRGEPVAALQGQLKAAGFDPGPVDGIFGQRTRAAVRKAQTQLGVQVDGLAGSRTIAALQRHGAKRAAAPDPAPAGDRAEAEAPPKAGLRAMKERQAEAEASSGAEAAAGQGPRRFALTFNGVPDPELLPRLLSVLKQNGMQATFFLLGETAARTPEVLAQIAAQGHEIGSNGYADLDMTRISEEMRKAQLRMAQLAITEAAGSAPTYFRPPGGRFSDALTSTARDMQLSMVLWTNVGARDLPEVDARDLADRLAKTVYPGAVVMLHQDRSNAVAALEQLLPTLRKEGYLSVGLSGLASDHRSTESDSGEVRN